MYFASKKLLYLGKMKCPCPFPQNLPSQFFSLSPRLPPWSLQEPHSQPFGARHLHCLVPTSGHCRVTWTAPTAAFQLGPHHSRLLQFYSPTAT